MVLFAIKISLVVYKRDIRFEVLVCLKYLYVSYIYYIRRKVLKILGVLLVALMLSFNASANNIEAEALVLTDEQNQKLTELKDRLKKEIGPIWDEIQAGRARILEIEKKYFEEFWGMLTPEQRAKYEAMSQKNK